MRVLVTGAGGFVGRRLVSALLGEPALTRGGADAERICELILTDRSNEGLGAFASDPRVRIEIGDICDAEFRQGLFVKRIDSIFHLAAALTSEAEADFARSLEINLLGAINLLEDCRSGGHRPRFIYPSSIAAFGGPLPERVDDKVCQTPQTSYGTAKAVAELLINDYSRHGFVDGRVLRLPVVLIRPGASHAAVSDRIAAIVRDPLRGEDIVCPLAPETKIPVASVRSVVAALIKLHEVPADRFGHTRAMNLPSLTVTAAEMVEALNTLDFGGTRGQVRWERDDELQALVDGWPRFFISDEASRLGIRADASFADILRAYVEDELRPAACAPYARLTA
jgi:D-erythronate 2-dehydrogenase